MQEHLKKITDGDSDKQLEGQIGTVLTSYLDGLRQLKGFVREVVIGVKANEPVWVFNVMEKDFSEAKAMDPRNVVVDELFSKFEDGLGGAFPVYLSFVNPSQLKEFLNYYKESSFDLRRIDVQGNSDSPVSAKR